MADVAFELPTHLPRSGQASDKSTYILTRVAQEPEKSLNPELAASWLTELDAAIRDTKSRISRRIQDDLPAFEYQLKSSLNVRTLADDLTRSVNYLSGSLSDHDTGILPALQRTLTTHMVLAEQASDSQVLHRTLDYLLRIKEGLGVLSSSVNQGSLSESVEASRQLQARIIEAPSPLDQAEVMVEIKKRHRTLSDRAQEQLGDAYARSVAFSRSPGIVSFTVIARTKVPPTSTMITLPEIFRSLSSDVLSTCLSALRRDIMAEFVEPILLSSWSLTSSVGEDSSTLTLASSPHSPFPLQSLKTLVDFLDENIFHRLPSSQFLSPNTFHGPVMTAILTHLIKPSIPSSLSSLPNFLDTVNNALRFEEELLPSDARDRPIQYWANDVSGHYEKRRREDVLQHAREVMMEQDVHDTIRVEAAPNLISPDVQEGDESGWDFDAAGSEECVTTGAQEAKGGNDSQEKKDGMSSVEDPSDGWGWGDDIEDTEGNGSPSFIEPPTEPSETEDDPWGDDSWEAQPPQPEPEKEPMPSGSRRTPKLAKRLEKFSVKAKGVSVSNTSVSSPSVPNIPRSPSLSPQSRVHPPQPVSPVSMKSKQLEKQTYLISARAKIIIQIAESLFREGQELMHSNAFSARKTSRTLAPGHLLIAAAPMVLDLYRALCLTGLDSGPDSAMRHANDCIYLSEEVTRLREDGQFESADEKWAEAGERFKVLGEILFDDAVALQQDRLKNALVGAQGFLDVMDDARFNECKKIIEQVLREIASVASKWKVTLTKSACLHALGLIVDDVLFRVMSDVLSLRDIPAEDSQRLSELCEMLGALEELFADVPGKQSLVGSHVPLWFKFSYLPWLLKGSIADLSYLFDQGMLVDYEIDELVRLVRSLFAETPLRENTISKMTKGHPILVDDDGS